MATNANHIKPKSCATIVGTAVGTAVGTGVGSAVGSAVGAAVGIGVGAAVGTFETLPPLPSNEFIGSQLQAMSTTSW